LTDFVKFKDCRPAEQRFVAEVFNKMLIDIRQAGRVRRLEMTGITQNY
jgi:hypothetical protein